MSNPRNAGRKPRVKDGVPVCCRLPKEDIKKLNRLSQGKKTIPDLVRYIIDRYIKEFRL